MDTLTIGKLTIAQLRQYMTLHESRNVRAQWTTPAITLTEFEQVQLQVIEDRLSLVSPHLLNEATIWARAIYPLLVLAESGSVRAWSEVVVSTQYPAFEVNGIIDGVLGQEVAGRLDTPYLVVVEAKKGIGGEDPVPQLYGQVLTAARLNWERHPQETQVIFGAYTIADTWVFVRAEVSGFESQVSLLIEVSKEYSQRYEAAAILKILKQIVLEQSPPPFEEGNL
ncbi:MAG TPA: hypothetical protein V6D18_11090 [Thermosynechococcaceae cyanobacterium]